MKGGQTTETCLVVEDIGTTRWLLLNRPTKMNALNISLANTLVEALDQAESDHRVRVLVISGTGRAFCSGADLKAFQRYRKNPESPPDFLAAMELLTQRLRSVSKPVIAAINGVACAGGLELVLCCDLVVALESAQIGDAHINFAAFPGGGGASVLARRIGMARAKYLLYTGELLPAAQWVQWSVVNLLAADRQTLKDITQNLADKLANKSPLVLREMKRIMEETENVSREQGLADEINTLRELCDSRDMAEGFSAFLEKRQALFEGR